MIIEIDGYFLREILRSDNNFTLKEIKMIYDELKNEGISEKQLPGSLCERYNMKKEEELKDLRVDIVIDTDTDLIYKPQY